MSNQPGPRDEYGRPQDHVPGRDAGFDSPVGGYGQDYGRQPRGGFSAFPFPSYSTRTRSGAQVTVGGCCLPIPLGCMTTLVSLSGYALYRTLRTRG